MADDAEFKYQLFLSYTRTPDAMLAREIDRFLESFHLTPVGPERSGLLRPLQVCIDCHDFSLPADQASLPGRTHPKEVLQVVVEHLARSRELLVLCSRKAAYSDWVDQEVRWFLEHRGPRAIRLALTEGEEPWIDPEGFFPKSVLEHDLHKGIAYDLRGYDARRARSWKQVPDLQRELVRLAADLCGTSAGDVYPSWLEAELHRVRAESLLMATTARLQTLAGDPARALFKAYDAHELHPSESTEHALREAFKVAVLHHHNRREAGEITGVGPGYLAGRWKQGDVFVKSSDDGRFRLLVTQRGRDGADPPGDVYLISNETQRALKLHPPEREQDSRVEEVAFDRHSQHVFVTRYFYLSVYTIEGRHIGSYDFSRHTKSPVHLVDGYLDGHFVIGADTKRGVWLVDPQQEPASTIVVRSERAGTGPAISVNIASNGRRAVLVFKSSHAVVISPHDGGQVSVTVLPSENVLFAAFADDRDDVIVSAAEDGVITFWEVAGNEIRVTSRTSAVSSAVDWVSLSEDGRRMAAVGANRQVFLMDRARGDLISTLDLGAAIDWASIRAVAPPPSRAIRPALANELGVPVPFDSATLSVRDVTVIDGVTWAFTDGREDGDTNLNGSAYIVKDGQARKFASRVSAVSKHHDVLWFSEWWAGGTPFLVADDSIRRLLPEESKPRCILAQGSVVWVGTSRGAYRHEGVATSLETPDDLFVEGISEVGERLWLRAREGCFVVERDRVVRVTERFLRARQIKMAGGATWILSDDAAYRVEGYFTSRVPTGRDKVVNILEVDGTAWIVERNRIHRVHTDRLRTVTGIAGPVNDLVSVGNSLWATTATSDFMQPSGPAYVVDLDSLTPRELGLQNARLHRAAGETFVSHGPENIYAPNRSDEPRALVQVREDGLRELGLCTACLQPVVEVDGEAWLLTTSGAYRWVDGSPSRIPSPDVPVNAALRVDAYTWLLSNSGAIRIEKDGEYTFFRTGVHPARGVVRVGGEVWILTGDSYSNPGPAFRIGGRRAFAHAPSGAGVSHVVEIESTVWFLTRKGGGAGSPVRFRRR